MRSQGPSLSRTSVCGSRQSLEPVKGETFHNVCPTFVMIALDVAQEHALFFCANRVCFLGCARSSLIEADSAFRVSILL